MSTGSTVAWNMPNKLNFLTVVPMFHCNGWCYPWTVPMLNGRTICLRNIDVKKIFELIDKYDVTHFGGAPIVLNMITGAPESDRKKLKNKVHVLTAGAPPPSIIFKKMKELGFEVMHVYGLTETYGLSHSVLGMMIGMNLTKRSKMKLKQDKEFDIPTLKEQQLWIPKP